MAYYLRLLGPFEIERAEKGERIPRLVRKSRAILAYLAVTGQIQTRRHLAGLFCQDVDDPAGTLRWHLSRIRRELVPEILKINGPEVAFNSDGFSSDYAVFQRTITNRDRHSIVGLEEAVNLYRGELLSDLLLPDAQEFDLWLLGQRAQAQQLYEQGAGELVDRLIDEQRYSAAIARAHTLLLTNPLLEQIHAQLVWLYARTNQREAALSQARQCREILMSELAVEPSDQFVAVEQAVVNNQPLPEVRPRTQIQAPEAAEPVEEPFVGRIPELRKLSTLWQKIPVTGGAVAMIDAVAGGGKSRLVNEFCRRHHEDLLATAGFCYETTRTVPYFPWLTILESRFDSLDASSLSHIKPHWRRLLSAFVPDASGQQSQPPDQQQLFRAVAELMIHLPQTPPICIYIEDLQWADDVSLQLFHFLAQRLSRAASKVLLIGTFRSEELDENQALLVLNQDLERLDVFTRIGLDPFNEREVEALIAELWPQLSEGFRVPHIRDALLKAAGGNPLFTTEILQELSGSHELPSRLPIPPSLTSLIERRLHQLPSSVRQVVETLAVLNRPGHFDLLRAISGRTEEETLTALEAGLRWRFLSSRNPAIFDFRHDLVRRGVIRHLSPVRRQRLHQRTALALSDLDGDPATLAFHWSRAGDLAQEAHFAKLAGDNAFKVYAHDDATRFYERVIEINTGRTERLTAELALGQVRQFKGQWAEAERRFLSVNREAHAAGESQLEAESLYSLGQLEADRGNYANAEAYFRDSRAIYEGLDDFRGLCLVAGGLGAIYLQQARHEESLVAHQRQLEFAEGLKDMAQTAKALVALGGLSYQAGKYEEVITFCERGLAIEEELGNRAAVSSIIGNLGLVQMRLGNYPAALKNFLKRLAIAEELENRSGVIRALNSAGTIYRLQGEIDPAMACLAHSVDLCLEVGDQQSLSLAIANLGAVLLLQEQKEQAGRALQQGIVLARRLNLRFMLCAYLFQVAEILVEEQAWQEADIYNAEALELSREIGRQDTLFYTQTISIRIDLAMQVLTRAAAVKRIEALSSEWPEPTNQAELKYLLWRINHEDAAINQEAATAFAALYEDTPYHTFRQRYKELTARELPPPEPLPSPPSGILSHVFDVGDLLNRTDRFIADLPEKD